MLTYSLTSLGFVGLASGRGVSAGVFHHIHHRMDGGRYLGAWRFGAWCLVAWWLYLWLGSLGLGFFLLLIMDGTNTHPVDGWMNGWVHLGTYMTLVDLMT